MIGEFDIRCGWRNGVRKAVKGYIIKNYDELLEKNLIDKNLLDELKRSEVKVLKE